MADPTQTSSKPTPPDPTPAESPTTARPIDFDDEQQESGVTTGGDGFSSTPTRRPADRQVRFNEAEEAAPPKPPRNKSAETAQAEATLIEAFPAIDAKVVKAVLTASGGQVEPAFNALLSMSDPDYVEEAPPAQPPRPTAAQRQVLQDEQYARQLAEHYQYGGTRDRNGEQMAAPPRQRQAVHPDDEERDHSFFDDDLPEIRENLRQGFIQTQSKVNKWISDFRKRIDGEEPSDEEPPLPAIPTDERRDFGASKSDQLRGIRQMGSGDAARARRSTDRDRYDADPRVLSDNFTELELHDAEADDAEDRPPPKPARPAANPDLFKPTPPPPQSGPVDEVDALYREPTPTNTPGQQRRPSPSGQGSTGKSKKWQPLTSVAPNPEADDGDPFSLGDSDEEKTKDLRAEDSERLKSAARANSQDQGKSDGQGLEATEHRGSVNKDADDLMKS